MIYRLYFQHANATCDNLIANPSIRANEFAALDAIHVVLKAAGSPPTFDADIAVLPALVTKAASIGIRIIPGFRWYETTPSGGYLDADRWQRNASALTQIAEAMPGAQIAGDVEVYFGSAGSPTYEQLAAAAQPLIDEVHNHNARLIIYPALPGDTLTQVIADAAGGDLELWGEYGNMYLPEYARRAPATADAVALTMLRASVQFAKRWPLAVVRHGLNDEYLHTYGAAMRARITDVGPHAPWIFDSTRGFGNANLMRIGTPDWLNGTSTSTTNEPNYLWSFATAGPTTGPFGALNLIVVTGLRRDLRSDKGTLLGALKHFYAPNVLQGVGNFTVAGGFQIPTDGEGPLFGGAQHNAESWQVVYYRAQDRVVLELRQRNASIKATHLLIDHPLKMTSYRYVVQLDGTTWHARFAVRPIETQPWQLLPATSIVPPLPVGAGAGHLWLGAGSIFGTRTKWIFDGLGLVLREDLAVWYRTLTDSERDAVLLTLFPR